MIDELIKIGQELEPGLRDLFMSWKYKDMVTGVAIDVDPYWEAVELLSPFGYIDFGYDPYIGIGGRYGDIYYNEDYRSQLRLRRSVQNLKADFNYRPGNWDSYCRSMRYPYNASPVIIRVSINVPLYRNSENFPTSFRERYPIVYEEKRGPAKLIMSEIADFVRDVTSRLLNRQSRSAPEIFNDDLSNSGTIGGILRGVKTNKLYLLTCGHVLGGKGKIALSGKSGRNILGKVVHFSMPPVSLTPDVCSAVTHPDERSVDLSVVELQIPNADIPHIEKLTVPGTITPVSDIRVNDIVTFVGKTSGRIKARMGPLTLWYPFEQKGVQRCFGGVFMLKPIEKQYVNEPIAKPGDSGAWVINETSLIPKWYGMVTAAEDGVAYGCFAEFIVTSAENGIGEQLKCID